MTSLSRSLAFVLALLLAACGSTPTPTANASPAPTFAVTPSPALVASPSGLPTTGPTTDPTTSPTATPTANPTPTATLVPGPLATRLAGLLRQVLDQQRTSLNIPGMTAAIIFPDGSVWSGASGLAQVSPAQRASVSTTFVVGSMSKTFVAATIMELAQEGALTLDDPLSRWLPDYPLAARITLRMLLSHTSGVFDLFSSPNYNRLVVRYGRGKSWTPQQILDNFVEAPYCDPGTCYHYSNTGFVLLGMVIEAQTGKSLGTVYRERFFTPLGLNSIYFQGDGPPPPNSARGYTGKTGTLAVSDRTDYRPTQSEATVVWAAGAIVASVPDIARWCKALYGGSVVSADSLAQMTAYVYHQSGDYGLGTRSRIYAGQRMYGHTGTLRGFNGAMWYMPDLDITVAVLTNRATEQANAISDALLAVAVPAVN